MALIKENNRQYYEGAQEFKINVEPFVVNGFPVDFTTDFDTNLKFLSDNPSNQNYNQNNFKIYKRPDSFPQAWEEINSTNNEFRVSGNTITFRQQVSTLTPSATNADQLNVFVPQGGIIPKAGMQLDMSGTGVVWSTNGPPYAIIQIVTPNINGSYDLLFESTPTGGSPSFTSGPTSIITYNPIFVNGALVVQLKKLDGGQYGSTLSEKAFGNVVEENYGSYAYVKLKDIINNFLVAYVGAGKLIPSIKRTDLIFFAKRAMQEFSYDTLKSIKSEELTIPHSLSIILPQDYVNYVSIGWYDSQGIKHPIYPANNLTQSPYKMPLQDGKGVPIQDVYNNNITGTSIVEERWGSNFYKFFNNLIDQSWLGYLMQFGDWGFGLYAGYGELYGMDPQYANYNGWFEMNEREGKINFSANLRDKVIILEYVSDGLAYNLDTKVPKMAEDAMYSAILYSVLSTRSNQPEYVVMRLKKDRYAKLRNAKIRLSNIKLEEITQVMRGKSKWIKH